MAKSNNFIFYSNINGLQYKGVGDVLEEVRADNFPVICLSETHLTSENDDLELSLLGYNQVSVESLSNKTGGVLIYIKDMLRYSVVSKISYDKWFWGLAINIEIEEGNSCIVGVYYRSPSAPIVGSLKIFNDWVDEIFSKIQGNYRDIVLSGDMNINWSHQSCSSVKQLQRIINPFSLSQIVNVPTRVTHNSSTIIDLVFVNNPKFNVKLYSGSLLSDHEALVVDADSSSVQGIDTVLRIKGKVNYVELTDKLTEVVNTYSQSDCDVSKYDEFSKNVSNCIETCRSEDVLIKRQKYCKFFTKDVIRARKEKIDSYIKFKESKSKYNAGLISKDSMNEAWCHFKTKRNNFVSILRKSKRETYHKMFDECGDDGFKIWKVIKDLISPNKVTVRKLKIGDDVCSDPLQIANELNQFFVNSIETLNGAIPNVPFVDFMGAYQSEFADFSIPANDEILKIAKTIKSKGGPEPSLSTVVNCWDVIGETICSIVKESLRKSAVPIALKRSVITPIPKVNGTILKGEMRPINVLPFVDKVIEAIVYEQILDYVKDNNILCEQQSGFRAKHSTETAINFVLNDWVDCLEHDEIILTIFLDLSRAFETIDRELLLAKLERIGVKGNVLNWLRNYLTDRTQVVKVIDVISDVLCTYFGVPQGSKLGPLLFILFINELPNVLQYSMIHLFADDTLIYLKCKREDVLTAMARINEDLDRVSCWMAMNKLSLNSKKSKAMIICKARTVIPNDLEFKIKNDSLEIVDSFKYLGVIIDKNLKFTEHFDYVMKKLKKKVSVLGRLRYCLPTKTKHMVFNALVKPHTKYCETMFVYANKSVVDRIQVILNDGMRHVLGIPYHKIKDTSVVSMLTKLKHIKFEDEIYLEIMTFIFKCVHNLLPPYFANVITFGSDIHGHYTRNTGKLFLKYKSTSTGYKSLFHVGVSKYNKLSKTVFECTTLHTFRAKLFEQINASYNC